MIAGVRIIIILVIVCFTNGLWGELIKRGNGTGKAEPVSVKRDIFRFGSSAPPPRIPTREEIEREKKEQQKRVEEDKKVEATLQEAATVVVYEGYVTDNGKVMALISIDGEYHVVSAKSMILDEVEVVKITEEMITLRVKDKVMEIEFKGGDEK